MTENLSSAFEPATLPPSGLDDVKQRARRRLVRRRLMGLGGAIATGTAVQLGRPHQASEAALPGVAAEPNANAGVAPDPQFLNTSAPDGLLNEATFLVAAGIALVIAVIVWQLAGALMRKTPQARWPRIVRVLLAVGIVATAVGVATMLASTYFTYEASNG